MDVLDDIFDTLDLKGALYFRTDFSSPWAVTVPPLGQAARFHLVVQGSCHVTFPSGAAACLGPGDLILIPGGRSHILADGPGRAAPDLETVLQDAGYDGRGVLAIGTGNPHAATQMICGHFNFRPRADHPLLRALPEYLTVSAGDRMAEPFLDELLRLIARRIYGGELGSRAAVTRLSEIVYIELLRSGVLKNPTLTALLSAFRDAKIGRALELIHEKPGDAWTVDQLAREVGMSRSRFSERFSDLIGVGPVSYLSDWRLQKALGLLEDRRTPVQQIATMIGYQSAAAFTRAFAGKFGMSPTEYRRIPI